MPQLRSRSRGGPAPSDTELSGAATDHEGAHPLPVRRKARTEGARTRVAFAVGTAMVDGIARGCLCVRSQVPLEQAELRSAWVEDEEQRRALLSRLHRRSGS